MFDSKSNNKSNCALVGRAAQTSDALVKGLADLVELLLGDLLADSGDLGDDGLAEILRSDLLLLERLNGLLGGAELVEHRLLGNEITHGGIGLGWQLLCRLLQTQGVLKGELLRVRDGHSRALDGIQQRAGLLDNCGAGLCVVEGLFFKFYMFVSILI